MIVEVPVFDKLYIKGFQGIEEKQIEIQPGISSILFKPCSGKSSFLNSVIFLYTGDLRQLDNYNYFYTLKYEELVSLVLNNNIRKLEDFEIKNDYLTVTSTTDLSFVSSSDHSVIDDYVVRFIFKRTIDKDGIRKFTQDNNREENGNCSKLDDVDYSYLCYDEDKFCFESRFQDVSRFFTNKTQTIPQEEIYSYIRTIVRKVFDLDVFISLTNQLVVSKNGKVVYAPPTTISYLVSIILHIFNPTNSVILVEDFVTKFDEKEQVEIISYLTELTYSVSFVKKIVFIGNNSEKNKWGKLINSNNITMF